jgi:hypothetical protein
MGWKFPECNRVEQLVSEHLALRAGWIQGEGSIVSGVQTNYSSKMICRTEDDSPIAL